MATFSLITIGSELLKGRIINTNAARIGTLLRDRGFALDRTVVIPDTREAIENAVREEMGHHDVVLMCGGLGPTKDDITKATLSEMFGYALVLHPPSLEHLKMIFRQRQRLLTPRNQHQAMVPSGCEVLPNPKGTAPGMWFEEQGKVLVSMPGVPFEMLTMMEAEVLPRIEDRLQKGFFAHRILRLMHIPESHVADRMAALEDNLDPVIDIAYLPRIDGIWLELSINQEGGRTGSITHSQAEALLNEAAQMVAARFEDKRYAYGEQPLPQMVGDLLQAKGLTLAVAESLTGGLLAATLVTVSGASHYFRGGITAYASEVKTQLLDVPEAVITREGVVSEAVALAMASGVRKRLQADIGLSTTGLAESEGTHMPHAWIGYADAYGEMAVHAHLYTDRNINRERTAYYALHLCLKNLQARLG